MTVWCRNYQIFRHSRCLLLDAGWSAAVAVAKGSSPLGQDYRSWVLRSSSIEHFRADVYRTLIRTSYALHGIAIDRPFGTIGSSPGILQGPVQDKPQFGVPEHSLFAVEWTFERWCNHFIPHGGHITSRWNVHAKPTKASPHPFWLLCALLDAPPLSDVVTAFQRRDSPVDDFVLGWLITIAPTIEEAQRLRATAPLVSGATAAGPSAYERLAKRLVQDGRPEEVCLLPDAMNSAGVLWTHGFVATVLDAAADCASPSNPRAASLAVWMLTAMKRLAAGNVDCPPDVTWSPSHDHYTSAIAAASRAGAHEVAFSLAEEMRASGIAPLWSAALERNHTPKPYDVLKLKRALECLRYCRDSPSPVALAVALQTATTSSDIGGVLNAVDVWSKWNLQPHAATCTALIESLLGLSLLNVKARIRWDHKADQTRSRDLSSDGAEPDGPSDSPPPVVDDILRLVGHADRGLFLSSLYTSDLATAPLRVLRSPSMRAPAALVEEGSRGDAALSDALSNAAWHRSDPVVPQSSSGPSKKVNSLTVFPTSDRIEGGGAPSLSADYTYVDYFPSTVKRILLPDVSAIASSDFGTFSGWSSSIVNDQGASALVLHCAVVMEALRAARMPGLWSSDVPLTSAAVIHGLENLASAAINDPRQRHPLAGAFYYADTRFAIDSARFAANSDLVALSHADEVRCALLDAWASGQWAHAGRAAARVLAKSKSFIESLPPVVPWDRYIPRVSKARTLTSYQGKMRGDAPPAQRTFAQDKIVRNRMIVAGGIRPLYSARMSFAAYSGRFPKGSGEWPDSEKQRNKSTSRSDPTEELLKEGLGGALNRVGRVLSCRSTVDHLIFSALYLKDIYAARPDVRVEIVSSSSVLRKKAVALGVRVIS